MAGEQGMDKEMDGTLKTSSGTPGGDGDKPRAESVRDLSITIH
jgi:hypothetical protein